jgi:hypothetical protein
MAIAGEVFGNTFGIGSRNHLPRKSMPRKVLESGNIINVVKVSDLWDVANFKELVSNQRVDLLFEELSQTLTVRVKYIDAKAEDEIVSRLLRFPPIPPYKIARDHPPLHERRKAIPIDTSFVYNNKYFKVTMSDGIIVGAACIDDGEQLH